ncbi:MAG: hypothetical protein IKC97_00560 [Clostridia bacterium]|nr:hypothetical protein [Clostridia bacterium]
MNDQTNNANICEPPLPTGLMMALAQNMHVMTDYAKLSDAARQRLIEQASRIHSREEMQALVNNLGQFLI